MNDLAKIHLSKEEKELIQNTKWIFSKRLILKKVEHLFTGLQQEYQKMLVEQYPDLTFLLSVQRSKIARGENYKGLPYVMLDYPALFEKNAILAVRTLFWWGNYFSTTLHISGNFMASPYKVMNWVDYFSSKGFYININDTEWEHHFEPHNYVAASSLTAEQIQNISKKSFFKAGFKTVLENWEEVTPALIESTKVYLEFLEANSLPTCERDL